MTDRLITAKELKDYVPLSRPQIMKMVDAGTFPQPLMLSEKRYAWRLSDVTAFVENLKQREVVQ